MKLVCKRSIPIILLILALVILALVALSPGFVWSQSTKGNSVTQIARSQQLPSRHMAESNRQVATLKKNEDGRLGPVIGPFSQPCSQTGNSKEAI